MSFLKRKKPMAEDQAPKERSLPIALSVRKSAGKKRMAAMEDSSDEMDSPKSISEAILRQRKEKHMADGGMVDIEENGEEEGSSPLDDMNADAALKELYDDEELSAQPEDSNLEGDDIDSDEHDMISAIRSRMKSKRS